MKVITIKQNALVLDDEEIARLTVCLKDVLSSGDKWIELKEEYKKFAKYMIVKLEELEIE